MAPHRDSDAQNTANTRSHLSRRRTLTLAGAVGGALATAGCLGGSETDTDSATATPTATATTTAGATATASATTNADDTATETATTESVSVTFRRVDSLPPDATATVYPRSLRDWLSEAALSGDTVRGHAGTFLADPTPILPTFDRLELLSQESAVAGTYDLSATGDTRYELLVGATEVGSVPESATVTPLSSLSEPRREFARRAIDSEGPRVYPETELGEWVRTAFFGGYYRTSSGTVYRGRELQQTDAEFFSRQVWCILSLSQTEATTATTLRLREIPISVQTTLNERLGDLQGATSVGIGTVDDSPLAQFASETAYLLTHTALLAADLNPESG